jgi:hypothetical protein
VTTAASLAGPLETIRTGLMPAEDLSRAAVVAAIALGVLSVVLLVFEVVGRRESRSSSRRVATAASGFFAIAAILCAILRPQRTRSREVSLAPRVVVLLDRSRSMTLSATDDPNGPPRMDLAEQAVSTLRQRLGGRVDVLAFGGPSPPRVETQNDPNAQPEPLLERADGSSSDLASAIRAVTEKHEDPPSSIVVVSDGRVELGDRAALDVLLTGGPRVDAVAVGEGQIPDAAIRSVHLTGAAVAHQPLPMRIEIGCVALSCGDLTVTVRELREPETAGGNDNGEILATGTATIRDGTATIELPVTLERAGTRALEVSLIAPKGDAIPDNDRRLLTIDVARERVRVLHIAGRPTFDVRALRTWLKADAAMDVVSFFILRTPGDDVVAPDEELALIPFPVRELFTEYLPTFDAIVFQDFDAEPYGLTPHLPAIARYVEHGGGLVHIGGPNAFSAGGYAGSPLARVTPVEIPHIAEGEQAADSNTFVPVRTAAGRAAPILAELETLLAGDDLPELAGTSILGDLRAGGVALWTHPKRKTPTGQPMPVLAIADVGDGRSIALGVDSTRRLAFSAAAAKNGGRGYDALFRGLLGWLMRDPRYEPVRGRLVQHEGRPPCMAGSKAALRIEASPVIGPARLRATLSPLAAPRARPGESLELAIDAPLDGAPPILVPLGLAPEGAFALRMSIGARGAVVEEVTPSALATRTLSVCERGGEEWADPRPDRAKLEELAKKTGGAVFVPSEAASVPPPKAANVALERTVRPLLPSWAWATLAAVLTGLHWFVRRRGGLA